MHKVLASEGSEIILTFLQKDLFISDFIFQQKVKRKTNILQDNVGYGVMEFNQKI